jgi:hypothetical protein
MTEETEQEQPQKGLPYKSIPWEEVVSSGLLLEANRRFFHPLGMALYTSQDEEGKVVGVGIFDAREDELGFYFEGLSANDVTKGYEIQAMLETKRAARMARFGSVIQPLIEAKRE